MLRTALRNLLAHKVRLLLSGLAVVLGVAFIAATLTFTDTLNRTFTDLAEDSAADVNVEPAQAFGDGLTGTPGAASAKALVPASVLDQVEAVDGVAAADGQVLVEGVYVLTADGDVLDTGGAPGLGAGWSEADASTASEIVEGRAPDGAAEIVLDEDTVETTGYAVGDTVTVLTTGPRVEAELVGVFRYGSDGGLAGASMVAFDRPVAQELLLEDGQFSSVAVTAERGVDHDELAERVAGVLGTDYQVRSAAELAQDQAAALEGQLQFINTFLLVFAGVALFVGSFLILNTFSMLVAQRTRELALMRALGAARHQVTRSVLVEAVLLGIAGSTTGLAVGYGLAHGLTALFAQLGLTIDASLTLTVETIGWSYLVGVTITLVSAYLPARRAAKVPPVAAMRTDLVSTARPLRARQVVGGLLAVTGAAALVTASLADGTPGALLATGAVAVLVGAIVLSPVLATPFIRVAGAVLPRLAGRTGHLARENALRNPRRTAATSSALMIGLALVTGFSIIGASARASVDELVDDVLKADYVLSTSVGQPFTPAVAEEVRAIDGVASVTQERYGTAKFDGEESFFVAYDPSGLDDALAIEFVSGGREGLADGLLVADELAREQGLAVGDEVEFLVPSGERRTLRVGGTYLGSDTLGEYLVSMEAYTATGGAPLDRYVYVDVAGGADPEAVSGALEAVVAAYPVVDLQDSEEFKEAQRGGIDQMLTLINALLGLSVLIAVLGVVNTLVLSVIERTRELGLLRALGMSRRQIRSMVRLESVLISVYGAVLGVSIGSVLGLSLTRMLADQGLTRTAVPGGQLAVFLVLGAVIGVVAAAFPARRAGRLDVLTAIATD